MSLITIDSLSYTYAGALVSALSDVSLTVDEGDYIAIVGANGSGKSTLVRCLNGLCSPPPGTVLVAGNDPSDPAGLIAARRSLALVFQSPADQLVASVVEEDVAFGLENLGVPRPLMRSRVESALAAVGLLAERARSPRFLSVGQQQRLAVAGAIAMEPRIVAFDEATSMIDPMGRDDILEAMNNLVAEGIAVLHVTHDMDEAARASRVAVLDGGRLAFIGTPAQLFSSGAMRSYRLAKPRSWDVAVSLGVPPVLGEDAASLAARAFAALGASAPRLSGTPHAGVVTRTATGTEPAFCLSSASMSYLRGTDSERLAVRDVSLELAAGTLTTIVGTTGSGKSSLLQLLDGLALPDGGRVLSFGVDTMDAKANLRSVRMRAPLAVQRPENAIFETYVGDEVAFGPRNQGYAGATLVSRVRSALNAVGLPFDEYTDVRTRTLSGGRKRRLALASILSLEPDALLLDEPTSALDPASREDVLALILDFVRGKRRGTVVMSTHSMEEAALADTVIVMKDGEIAYRGPPREAFGAAWRTDWGLRRPFDFEFDDALRTALRDGVQP